MGLPARQRRVLGRIESALRGADPRLAALYSIFARLTREEEMPRIEQLRHSAVLGITRARLLLARIGSRVFGRLIPRPAMLLFPLALCLAAASIVFAIRASNGPSCSPVLQLAATGGHGASSKLCKNEPAMGLYSGR